MSDGHGVPSSAIYATAPAALYSDAPRPVLPPCFICGDDSTLTFPGGNLCAPHAVAATLLKLERDHKPLPAVTEPRESRVYYLRFGDRVKIGCAVNPAARVAALAISPSNIAGTEPGGYPVERKRHSQFAHLHLEGEWFAAGCDLLDHIAGL